MPRRSDRRQGWWLTWWLVLLVPAWFADAVASEAAVPPAELFYRHQDIESADLSPSGRRLAVATGIGGDRVALAVFDLAELDNPKIVARFNDADVRSFRWVNEERLVFDIIDLGAGGGDQPFGRGLFSIGSEGGELRQLIKLRREFLVERRLAPPRLEANHRLLFVPETKGNDVIVGKFQRSSIGDVTAVLPLRLDVTTYRVRSLAEGSPEGATGWLFDPAGEPRVAMTTREGRTQLHWRAPGQDRWRQLADFPTFEMNFVPRFVDGAGQLFVTTVEGDAGYRVLKRFDFRGGQPESTALVSTPGYDFDGEFITADDDSGRTLGVRVETDAETTVWFDPRLKQIQQAVDARLPGRINRISCRRCDGDDATVLVHSWSDREPGQYWIHRPASGQWLGVGRTRQDVDAARMATLDLHRIRARDGLELPVWVTRPAGDTGKAPRPAVVLVHGGPWVRGVHWRWNDDAQFLASRGYVVIEPEFRGSTGYGTRHFRAGWKQWGRAMQDDVADAVRWAAAKGWVDAGRVCIAGASYGGYATLMGLARDGGLYRCGVAWVGVTDPRLMFGLPWVNDISEEGRLYQLPTLLGDPVADAAALADVAPVELADRIKAPLLLAYGGADTRVPLEHGERMRAALRAAGQDPQWVVYRDEWHGWLKPENRFDFARRMEAFLARHLK